MRAVALVMLVAAAGALAWVAMPSQAAQVPSDAPAADDPWGFGELFAFEADAGQQGGDADYNVAAFLAMLRMAEGTAGEPDPYRVCFAKSHTVQSFKDHPKLSGEWAGQSLSDGMCRRAGFSPGCVSTAAGAYQLIAPTWDRARKALRLSSFEPANQDAAAVWLLDQAGALGHVKAGRVREALAIKGVQDQWASLPGNYAGQGQRPMGSLLAWFQSSGGNLA